LLGNLDGGETVLVLYHEIGTGGDELFDDGEMTKESCSMERGFAVLMERRN
jgi:hypothetical protein